MDIETLYHMARVAARGAERACEPTNVKSEPFFESYGGYSIYIAEYNRLVPLVIEQFGEEAERLFQIIDLGKAASPSAVPGMMWRTYADLAAARLNALAAFLQTKVSATDRKIESIVDLIGSNLRPAMFNDPQREVEVQNALEVIFRARALDYRREKISIVYSSKKFIPDFTFESLDLAVEVKLCKSIENEKAIIDEINADIPAYQTRYRRIIFVVYDLGAIRDVGQFKSGIEGNADVYVQVVKK